MRRQVIAYCALLAACTDEHYAPLEPHIARVETKVIPVSTRSAYDILFVIDNSPSMADEQSRLLANYPRFMQVLAQLEGGLPSVHIGVISTDPADAGRLLATPRVAGCTPPQGSFIVDVDTDAGVRAGNYAGSLPDAFTCIAALGSSGGQQQPLAMIHRALIDPQAHELLRPEAKLVVVIITDEDDRSPGAVAAYADHIAATKRDRRDVLISVIAPLGTRRLGELARYFPERYVEYPIEGGDLTAALALFAEKLRGGVANPCFETSIDPATCVAADLVDGREVALRRCEERVSPCWYIAEDPVRCAQYPTTLTFVSYPNPRSLRDRGTWMRVECIVRD